MLSNWMRAVWVVFAMVCSSAHATVQVNGVLPPPTQNVLVVGFSGAYDTDTKNIYYALRSVISGGYPGSSVEFLPLQGSAGVLASYLANSAIHFDQIWVVDLSAGVDNYLIDYQAIATWYANHPSKHIITDARILGSYWYGRHLTEGTALARNYFHNLALVQGGLVLATDHDPNFTQGINTIDSLIGIGDFLGYVGNSTQIPIDTNHVLMTTPNGLGGQLFADSSPGFAPMGVQSNGKVLRGIAFYTAFPTQPGITTTILGAHQSPLLVSASPSTIPFNGTSALSTSGGSGTGAVSYAVTAGAAFCAITGTTLTGTGVGNCTITATKAEDTTYNATRATVDVTVTRATQAPLSAIAAPASIRFNDSSELSTSGGSGTGGVSYVITLGVSYCSVSGTTLTGIGVGSCTVKATKAADANYNAASATVVVIVDRAFQAALSAFAQPTTIAFNGTSTLSSSGGSGNGGISYSVTSGAAFCSTFANTLTGVGVGTCTVTVTKGAGTGQHYYSTSATVDVTVVRADQATLSVTASPTSIPFNESSSLSTSGGSGTGAVSYAVTAGAEFCSMAGQTLTGIGVGACTITASKAGDANYSAAIATTDVTVLAAADLQISNSDGSSYAAPGAFVEYQILVANAGPLGVVGANVQNPLPAGLSDALWTCEPVQGASCTATTGNGAIDELIDLPADAALRYRFSALVTASLGDTITNTAMVSGPAGTVELDEVNNIASDVNTVKPDGVYADGFETAIPIRAHGGAE